MALSRTISGILVSATLLLGISPTQAQDTYSFRDAEYVSNTKNIDVLRYIVCLEDEAGKQPRRLDIATALERANAECRSDAVNLPNGRNDPTADEIQRSILECGFRPGTASPDMGCGGGAGVVDEIAVEATLIDTGKWLEGIAFDGQSLWAAESGQRTVAQIDFNTHKVTERYKVGRLPVAMSIGDRGDAFALVATDQTIKRLDNRGNAATLATLDDYPQGMSISGDQLWVLGSPDGRSDASNVVRIDTQTGKQKKSRDLGQFATSILTTEDEVWVSHARGGELSVIDQSSLRDSVIKLPGVEIWKLASDFNFVYGGGRVEGTQDDGLLIKINPVTRQEEARVSLPEMISEVATDGTFVFAVGPTGTIWVVSATDMKLLRSVRPSTLGESYAPTDILIFEDYVAIAARQFYDANGDAIKDRRGNEDENGAILLMLRYDIAPDGAFEPTQRADAGRTGQRPYAGTNQTQRPTATNNGRGRPANTRPTGTSTRPIGTATRPPGLSRPTGSNGRPASTNNHPTRPTTNTSRSQFPVVAGSRGGNVRSAPSISGSKVGSTGDGQPVTLLENTGRMYNGYPWFKVRMANGITGYQWGGGTCANPQTPIAGTKGVCERSATGKRPNRHGGARPTGNSGTANASGKADEIDLAISILDLFGKIVTGDTNSNTTSTAANPNVFAQTLQVPANGQGVFANRRVEQNQAAVYSVKGRKDQTLDVSVWSPTQNAVFEIYIGQAADHGATLPGAAQGANTQSMRAVLAADNDYKIVVGSVNGPVDFQLVVSLEPAQYAANGNRPGAGNRSGAGTRSGGTAQSPNPQRAGGAADWRDNPQDPRANNDYSAVYMGFESICETGNIDPSSPDFNNETAYWDCEDRGLIDAARVDPVAQGGQLSDDNLLVGTYSSPSGPSGNIELDQATATLSWTEFCKPAMHLKADWPSNQLIVNAGSSAAFALDISNYGEVLGFTTGGAFYSKEPAIMMPNCSAGTVQAGSNNFVDWGNNPQDSRKDNDWSAVANAYWGICEAANWDENSPAFNNEQAFWDCGEAGLAEAAAANASAVDLNPGGAYSALPEEVLQTCQGDIACLDAGVSQASRANAQGVDNILANEFSDLTDEDIRSCEANDYGSPGFYDCLKAVRASKQTASGSQEPGWDRETVQYQEAYDYCAVDLALDQTGQEYGNCYYTYPDYQPVAVNENEPAADAQQDALADVDAATQADGIRADAAQNYADLSEQDRLGCEGYGLGTQDYYDCLEAVRASYAGAAADAAAQPQPEPAQQAGGGQIEAYCQQTYADANAQECTAALNQCLGEFPDMNSAEFGTCAVATNY